MADVRGDELELLVGGTAFTGWEKVQVVRQLDAASGSFALEVSGQGVSMRTGDEVTVRLAGQVVLQGFVDEREASGTATDRKLAVAGRDRTADLVDCSEVTEPGEWQEIGLLELVQLLCTPFGIEVRSELEAAPAPFARFARQSGETVWSAVERACRLRGVLAHASGDGALVLARAARQRADAVLREGENVLAWRTRESTRQRFQTYTVRSQFGGSDDFYGEASALIEGQADDPGVTRFRPLLVLAEGALVFENAQDRARWEATVRAARADTISVTVPGWRQTEGGRPWELNEEVRVVLPGAGVDRTLLVNALTFTRDGETGPLTAIELVRRDAYDPQPVVDEEEGLGVDLSGEEGG